MKRIVVLIVAILSAVIGVTGASAEGNSSDEVKKIDLVSRFLYLTQSRLVEAKDMGMLYEVIAEQAGKKNLMYVTKDGKYLVFGSLVDRDGKNLTKERQNEISRVEFSKIPLNDALVMKKGNGKRKLVMVTDIDCPYCRKAFEWLDQQTDYTLYVYLFPLEQLHPQARDKSLQILCSKDKEQALRDAKSGKSLSVKQCGEGEAVLAKQILVGQILGLNGTPLFVLDSGSKVEGFNQPLIEQYLKMQ